MIFDSEQHQAGSKNIESLRRQVGKLKREKDILDRKHISSDRASSLIFDLSKVYNNLHEGENARPA